MEAWNRPASVVISRDHAFELRLRHYLFFLWQSLPLASRQSWEQHPDYPTRGAWFSFYWTNYTNWRSERGPILNWPENYYTSAAVIISATAELAGNVVTGELGFVWGGTLNTLAFAFYHRHRWTVFNSGLRRLAITNGIEPFSFRFSNLASGWCKGIVGIFSEAGYLSQVVQLPTLFIT